MLLTVAVSLGIGYLGLLVFMYVNQRNMLYFPDTSELSPLQARELDLRHWPSSGRFHGFVAEPNLQQGVRGTVIVFHGNGGAAFHRFFYAKALVKHHFRVLLAEYPGYGGRDGQPAEKALVQDGVTLLELAHAQFGAPLYLWGESLGCGVAAGVVRQTRVPVAGVVLFLPWDTLADVAAAHYPLLPVRWLLRDRYDNVANLRHFKGPVAVLLAGEDEIIPPRHGRHLYEKLMTNKKLWVMQGAGHNSMPMGTDQPWWQEVTDFLTRDSKLSAN
ncbi:MAG: alpha/beta hydrolase [Desulfobulbus sp.]|nr:alpha/beta hydrolase [Desulfobulbus sp.]